MERLADRELKPLDEGADHERGPVFVVGMNGSGTTLLLDLLNNHSDLYGFPSETKFLPRYMAGMGRYGNLASDENAHRLWQDLTGEFVFWKANGRVRIPIPEDWREHERSLAAVFDWIMHCFAARDGKSRWCEKTPMHLVHMLDLLEQFPDARFLHIVRDGRDSAASFHRRWGYRPEATIFRWKKVVGLGLHQGQQLGDRCLQITYEELTRNPERVMRQVSEFLLISFQPAVLNTSRGRPNQLSGGTREIVTNPGTYRSYFSSDQLERLERIAGKQLSALGYECRCTDGNVDPSWVRRRIWSLRDNARVAGALIATKLKKGQSMPWRQLAGRIRASFQQKRTNRF